MAIHRVSSEPKLRVVRINTWMGREVKTGERLIGAACSVRMLKRNLKSEGAPKAKVSCSEIAMSRRTSLENTEDFTQCYEDSHREITSECI